MTDKLVLPTSGLTGCYIGGEWTKPEGGRTLKIENPSRRTVICEIGASGPSEVDRAVKAARKAFPAWRKLAAAERGKRLTELGNRMEAHLEEIARLLAAETGNALRTQSRGETAAAVGVFKYYGGTAVEQKGETLPFGPGLFSYSTREPHGVVGAIIPWNSPLVLAAVKISMALATGNCMIMKPAEDAPLAVLKVFELAADIFPAGVLNVITGLGEVAGAALTSHEGVDKVSFTGSSEVGRLVGHAVADRIAHVTLELGGKSPTIVFPDAADDKHINKTVAGIVNSVRFARQGQSCTAGTRLFLHKSIWDKVLPRVVEAVRSMKVGDALEETSDIGAVINAERYNEIRSYLVEAKANGANFALGDVPAELTDTSPMSPQCVILTGIDNSWRAAREEIFGPVLCVIPWENEDEVVEMANDTHYGLAAFVFTHDVSNIIRMSRLIDAGWLQINQGGGQIPGMSYGGIKRSGIGSEYSIEGALEAYTFRKCVTIAVDA